MLQSDKVALNYRVIANTAMKIEKVARDLESMYNASYFNVEKANMRKKHLQEYIKELEKLTNN